MPRRQVTLPVTNAFRVATPDILRQILLYATTSTLASCVRVSQNFYHVAAPILYQDVVFHNDDLHFLQGADVKPKAVSTRSAPKVTNLKLPLLQHIKTVTTTIFERRPHPTPFSTFGFPCVPMPRFDTVRVRFQEVRRCQLCVSHYCEYIYVLEDPILTRAPFKKLVLLPSKNMWYSLLRWQIACTDFDTLTVVVSPSDWNPTVEVVRSILRGKLTVKLRIILRSWYQHEELRARKLGEDEDGGLRSTSLERLMLLVHYFSRYITAESHVYLIEPRCINTHHSYQKAIFPTKACAAELFKAFEAKWSDGYNGTSSDKATVVFKDRKDYLMEGVSDEVDPEELARWKRVQDWEDQADFYDQYHPMILDQQREQLDYYANHPDIIPVARLIEEYQIDPDILFLAEEERRAAAQELAQWIDEGVTMILVQELVYRHHFYNLFYPSRKSHNSQAITTNHPDRLPVPEPIADARPADTCARGQGYYR